MSVFLSWYDKDDKIYFLTRDMVFNTEKGEHLRKELHGDFIGHEAIRFYTGLNIDLEKGRLYEKECTDFSSPSPFPEVIAEAIKRGEFRGFGTPKGLLQTAVDAKWRAERVAVDAKWGAERNAERNALYAKWGDEWYAKWDAKWRAEKYAEWDSINPKFWDLFAIPENRAKVWR